MKAEGKLVAPVADWETKRRWVNYAFAELRSRPATPSAAPTPWCRTRRRTKFVYRDGLWRRRLAAARRGLLRPRQRRPLPEPHGDRRLRRRLAAAPPINRAYATEEERMIREFILQLKLGRVKPRTSATSSASTSSNASPPRSPTWKGRFRQHLPGSPHHPPRRPAPGRPPPPRVLPAAPPACALYMRLPLFREAKR